MTAIRRPPALLLALALAASGACGGGGDDDKGAPEPKPAAAAAAPTPLPPPPVESPAAELRARLTYLLQDHVFLTAFTTMAILRGQDPAPAAAALDQNGAALAEAVKGVYGEAVAAQFLDLWRRHVAFLSEYSSAQAGGDKGRSDKAKGDLEVFRKEFGVFMNSVNPHLAPDAVADDLKTHVTRLTTAIDAQVKKDPSAFDKLKKAADHMPQSAAFFVAGFAKDKGDALKGSADSLASTLRAILTAKLQEHVYLTGAATGAVLTGGDFKAADAAVHANSTELSNVVASVYGDDHARRFLGLWGGHIRSFMEFARGTAAKDQATVDKARADLDRFRSELGAFFNAANPNLVANAVAEDQRAHVESLLDAIAAQAANDAAQFAKLRDAASHAPATATFLASGIAKQFKDRFG